MNESNTEPRPLVDAVHARAAETVETVVADLRGRGWGYAAVSVAAIVPLATGQHTAPGASRFDVDERMLPTLPHHADNLRVLARELDELHTKSGVAERTCGYSHVVKKPRIRVCRACHCTDYDCSGCVAKTGHPCWWVEGDLCSACAAKDAGVKAPPPQTMAERWADYERECMPVSTPAALRVHLRRAFYGGAVSLSDVAPLTAKTEPIVGELMAFREAVERGAA